MLVQLTWLHPLCDDSLFSPEECLMYDSVRGNTPEPLPSIDAHIAISDANVTVAATTGACMSVEGTVRHDFSVSERLEGNRSPRNQVSISENSRSRSPQRSHDKSSRDRNDDTACDKRDRDNYSDKNRYRDRNRSRSRDPEYRRRFSRSHSGTRDRDSEHRGGTCQQREHRASTVDSRDNNKYRDRKENRSGSRWVEKEKRHDRDVDYNRLSRHRR